MSIDELNKTKIARSYENAENEDELLEELEEEIDEKKSKKKKKRKKKILPASLKGDLDWQKALAESMKANEKAQEKRLSPWINYKGNASVKFTPLGGLGAIGGNMSVIEYEDEAIIIDVGMSFPDADTLGVDIVVPDFSYIRKIKDKVKAVLITHAHEDHIGAMPYFYKEFDFPIYATPLPLGMISNKFSEHGLKDKCKLFRPITKREIYEIGSFKVEFIHITHSIIDSCALAINTPAGTIIHTGDFKIDHTPIDGYASDLHRLAYYGEKGVLCLFSDSTNSYREGVTKSESTVGATFDLIYSRCKGRVIMSTFSSNIHRIHQAITHALNYNRKVCIIGRSMERNLFTAIELGYLKFDKKIFISADELDKFPDEEILIITTGSQGESMSALYRMATSEHKHVKIKPSDQVIISAKAIPGNEASVSGVIDLLMRHGASVAYQEFSEIHVSGHAAAEEQKLILRLVKPKYFLPVHGEYSHISKHKASAIACGVNERNIYLLDNGDQMEISWNKLRKLKSVKTGKTYIDNQVDREVQDDLLNTRKNLAEHGIVQLNLHINMGAKTLNHAHIINFGLVSNKLAQDFGTDVSNYIKLFIADAKEGIMKDKKAFEPALRNALKKYFFKKYKKYPYLLLNIH